MSLFSTAKTVPQEINPKFLKFEQFPLNKQKKIADNEVRKSVSKLI